MVHYLLGLLPKEEHLRFEAGISANDRLREELMAVEHELMDDYVTGQLSEREREMAESHFLRSRERRQKLIFAEALKIYTANSQSPSSSGAPRRRWWRRLIGFLFRW